MKIGHIENGIVLDHITPGNGMNIYNVLDLGHLDCTVALIKNADSPKMGKKDIIKISTHMDIDLAFRFYKVWTDVFKERWCSAEKRNVGTYGDVRFRRAD